MKFENVSVVSVITSLSCEEPVSALLENLFGGPAAVYSNAETGQSIVSVYPKADPKELQKTRPQIEQGLGSLKSIGLDPAPAEIRMERVKREDWSESWKKFFKKIVIGRALVIKPSWSKHTRLPGQAVVVLDPGLSFGTGQHATTSFCLAELVKGRPKKETKSFLDIGTGSGILAISAAKLGYTPVEAFDFDPVAARIAQKNCQINRVEQKVSISRKDLTRIPLRGRRKFEFVCANIITPLLIAECARITNRVSAGGTLVLAGILQTEFPKVRDAFEEIGFKLLRSKVEREWESGSFEAPPPH